MPKDFKVKIKKMLEGTGPLMQSKFVPEWKKLYPDTPFDVTAWGFERLTGTCTHARTYRTCGRVDASIRIRVRVHINVLTNVTRMRAEAHMTHPCPRAPRPTDMRVYVYVCVCGYLSLRV